jgi:DNA-binding transcriptional LysR family regulator
MECRHLRYFLAIAEERNLARAAERLWVAQPSLEVLIRFANEREGVQLTVVEAYGGTLRASLSERQLDAVLAPGASAEAELQRLGSRSRGRRAFRRVEHRADLTTPVLLSIASAPLPAPPATSPAATGRRVVSGFGEP